MTKADNYICTKGWARNKVGDIVPHFTFRKYPPEVQQECFKPVQEVKAKPAKEPVEVKTITPSPTKLV